ncbi:MAG: aminoglycoside phosphotransferase family protein [Clostridia bacterium]|nr:aminoglycoside phosphotransferase family protein [Clostridia bacterium]
MRNILSQFRLEGAPVSCARYGNGHINETYKVETDAPHAYILQKINRRVFSNVPGLMRNIAAVTAYLRRQADDPRRVLTLIPTVDGESYYVSPDQDCWRMYEFITDSLCLDQPESWEDLKQSGVAFGEFQNQLADYPADTLIEVIPRFHDTPDRFRQLKEAIARDPAGRLSSCQPEIDFYLAHESEAGCLIDLLKTGKLPLRVTHNDTKLNNVMLDQFTRTPLCVIDLDTIMPGLAAHDFGDSIRFGASTAAEDEKDLDKVEMSLSLFEAYAEGFLSACGSRLTALEKETLPMGAKLMTLECGSRFLADYLNGDVYFHTARPEHNLDRARTQMKLVRDMENKWDAMRSIIAEKGLHFPILNS